MTAHERIAKRNIVKAFNWIVGGYYNSIQDGYLEDLPDTKEDLRTEIYESSMQNLYDDGYEGFGKAPKEMRFAGREFCYSVIDKLLKTDEDVEEIAEVKGWS